MHLDMVYFKGINLLHFIPNHITNTKGSNNFEIVDEANLGIVDESNLEHFEYEYFWLRLRLFKKIDNIFIIVLNIS